MSDADEPSAPVRRSAPFVRFWAGHAVSSLGDQVSALALPYTAVSVLHAPAVQVGLLTAALWLPGLLALPVGTWVDGLRRRRLLMCVANLGQAVAVLAVPVAAVAGRLSIGVLLGAAFALGLGGVLYGSAWPSFFVRLVARDRYVAANASLSTTAGLAAVAGPAVAGALIQVVTAPLALLIDAGSFLVSAAAIASVRLGAGGEREEGREDGPFLRRLAGGAVHLLQHRVLRASLLASATMNGAGLAVQALLVLYAARVLHLNAGGIGLALGVGAFGGVAGAVSAVPVGRLLGTGGAIALGVALAVLPYLALPAAAVAGSGGLGALVLAEAVSSWALVLFDVHNNALRAAVTRDDLRGRVAGAYSTVNLGVRPIGALAAGVLAGVAGPGPVIAVAALVGCSGVLWILRSPIARLRHPTDPSA